ncbi:hypothetical protein [Zhenhengia yiwuensis]|uniref:Uncharacterized protein n=1 Tax=Zhenhengia yiwuensis TaxID=2763666 RepID=A0A926EIX4_9FIRM|nr:hypothetical protein [Zhenhengia yiwuensis]MBC8579850.1 hypothetical protein [Zhenhengia yiwuensis]
MAKNNLNFSAMSNLVTGGEIQLMEMNQKLLTGMNNMPVKFSKKSSAKKKKKHKKQGAHDIYHGGEEESKKAQPVEKRPRPAYEELPRNTAQEPVEVERTYWQEAMVLSELLGTPVCKRRNRRRSSYR